MFHTIEVFIKLTNREYFCWLSTFLKLARDLKAEFHSIEENETVHEYIFKGFKDKGVNILLKSYECNEFKYYEMSIILNPKRLLELNEYVDVARAEDLPLISREFKKVMLSLKNKFNEHCSDEFIFIYHNLINYKVKRIDYCVNVRFNDVDKVIKLIKRGDIPHHFFEYTEYDKKSKRKKTCKDSFYLISKSRSITVNIYAKYNQMKKEKYYKNIDVSKAKGILRVEIQCRLHKITAIARAFNLDSQVIFNLATNDIAKRIILYYLYHTIGFQDFIIFKKAKERINSYDGYTAKTKNKMLKILKLISEKRSMFAARQAYGNDKEFYKIVNKIKKLDINPITVPEAWDMEISNPASRIVKELMPINKITDIN